MPTAYILIGVSGSGKTTWAKSQPWDMTRTVIAGTDKHIEAHAAAQGKTWDQAYSEAVQFATDRMDQEIQEAIAQDMDIVWDLLSITRNCRQLRMSQLPEHYTKIAVYFVPPPLDELERRILSRTDKQRVTFRGVCTDLEYLTPPTLDEGFSEIKEIWSH